MLLSSTQAFAHNISCVQSSRDLISELYRDYPVQSDKDIAGEPRHILRHYFDANLVQLFLAEQKCAAKTHDQCHLDFNILSNTQNVVDDTSVRVLEATEHRVKLKVGGQFIDFKMRMQQNCMRIQDIEYNGVGSLKDLLSIT